MGDDSRSSEQVRHLSPSTDKIRLSDGKPGKERRSRSGPRSLHIKRSEDGFGFTLRHFVVYPPESYTMLSYDQRYGLRGAPVDRPMDTIFVQSVRSGSSAAAVGLSPGDQLIGVNGKPIAGLTYAQVVHLIQSSPSFLHLLVVPKEEDILQLYYGDAAHNPTTNPRPRISRGSPNSTPASSSPARRGIDNSPSHFTNKMPLEPEFSGSSESMPTGYSLPPNLAGCRFSLDGGSGRSDSLDTTLSSDDSIMCRIRKSLEQKEEFLKNVSSTPSTLREFYSHPQKLQPPVWPPAIPARAVGQPLPKEILEEQLSPRGFLCGGLVTNAIGAEPGRHSGRMSRPQESSLRSRQPQPRRVLSPQVRQTPPLNNVPPLRIVSEVARQFETGSCLADKTDLHRSELSRLSNKRNVPNVAVRRREFENRAADWRQHQRESRSLDSTSGSISPTPAGNRTIPVGGTKLHCDPPKGYRDASASDENKNSPRPRSNSVEGVWTERKPSRSCSVDPPLRHKAVRQDSYLAAVKKPVTQPAVDKKKEAAKTKPPKIEVHTALPAKRPQRPTRLDLVKVSQPSAREQTPSPNVDESRLVDEQESRRSKLLEEIGHTPSPASTPDSDRVTDGHSPTNGVVKRPKPQQTDDAGSEDERATRRVSYLKATWADRGHPESDLELSDNEPILSPHRRAFRKWRPPLFPDDIQKIVRLFEPMPTICDSCVVAVPPNKDQDFVIEGCLYCKVTQIEGKKAHDRSWRSVWAVVRASTLYLFKEKKDATSETPVDHERLDLTNSTVSAAEDYTKKRHVFRLSTPSSSEILLQAESAEEMSRWLSTLAAHDSVTQVPNNTQNISPVTAHKGIMKNITTTFRNRSPTGQSPVNKTRKPSGKTTSLKPDAQVAAPNRKTWRLALMTKQLKKIQSGSPPSPLAYHEGATIGVPIELCPRSKNNVPLLVELCTSIVEERGLETTGIYRVPGNAAAIISLTEAVNKGLRDDLLEQDQRWSDVNVISSLLKLFFRKLPDCLLTTELYPSFIKADKIEDPRLRILSIRKLVQELPEHNHATLKHLMMHLKVVVEHSAINKMEARNLAIVFGPTLVRTNDDNMIKLVTDMSHQCRIVETLIQHAEWCFSNDGLDTLRFLAGVETIQDDTESNQTLLLGNVHKLEGMKGGSEVSKRDIVTSIISAANKKMKSKTRKQVTSTGDEIQTDRGDKRKDSSGGKSESLDSVDGKSLVAGAVAAGVRDSVMFSESIIAPHVENLEKEEAEKAVEVTPSKPLTTNDGTILTYTGLSETTQERIRRFEMETKAMLQRDKILNNKDWLKPTAPTAIGSKIADEVKIGGDASPLSRWKQITSPSSQPSYDPSRVIRGGSLDSLTDANYDGVHSNNNESVGGVDLVSSLTLTFDAKMKSLGLVSPSKEESESEVEPKSFRDPSLHRSFPSPHKELKNGEEEKKEEKSEVEKDDEKENLAVSSSGKLKRSESLKQQQQSQQGQHLRRSESLNKKDGAGSGKLKRSDSLSKTEKTDLNLTTKRRQALLAEVTSTKKMKRKTGGGGERSIKRRHTVGGTKDFDKAAWLLLDNRERESVAAEGSDERRSSSPDLRPVLVLRPHSLLIHSPLESHI